MLSLNAAAVDNNVGNHLQTNNIYIYKGGEIDEDNGDKIKHVRIDEEIDDYAFYECGTLQTVSFSTSHMIKKIGTSSFHLCENLLSIDLQDKQIESIGNYAFRFCNKLATIQFPVTVRKIGKECFADCTQLKIVDLSHANHLELIETGTFMHCSTLATINLPPTTSCIGERSFYGCKALETVDLRSTCGKEIGERAFFGCKNLTNIYLPTTMKCIGQDSFCGCMKLSYFDLQATSVESIGDCAFQHCSELTTINFPKTLRYIGKESFYGCDELNHLKLHETLIERIGDYAFYDCANLTTVIGISTSHQEGDVQERMDDYGSMILPASLVEIGKHAFDECPALKNSINNHWIHYQCDLNCGGRRFLQRDHHQDNDSNDDDGDAKRHGKVYYSSLWPLILHRVMNEMKLPKHRICPNDDNLSLYTQAGPVQRRASVVFNLLIHGVVADLQSQVQSRNIIATQTHKAAASYYKDR